MISSPCEADKPCQRRRRRWRGSRRRLRSRPSIAILGVPISQAKAPISAVAGRHAARVPPIAIGITRYAILAAEQPPKRTRCARSKPWRAWSVAAVVPALDTRRPVFCGVLSKRWGFLRGKSVLDLFRMPRSARAAIPLAAPQIAPTDERRNHGKIEPVPHAIADHHGRSARPFRAVDTLTAMERRGTITAAMRQAAEDFRSRFAVAQLDPLRALDYLQPRTGKAGPRYRDAQPAQRIETAREEVWRALLAVGGPSSPGGSCLWHVVGWEQSIKDWALGQGWNGRRISQETAAGILVATLGALEAHYRGPR